MWIDDLTLVELSEAASQSGSLILELPLDTNRFFDPNGSDHLCVCIASEGTERWKVFVPDTVLPRDAAVGNRLSETRGDGWAPVEIGPFQNPSAAIVAAGSFAGLPDLPERSRVSLVGATQVDIPITSSQTKYPAPKFTSDLTSLAESGSLPPVVGRRKEVAEVVSVLMQAERRNPLLIGEPGVGKTAVVHRLAGLLSGECVPPRLQGARIFELDTAALLADSGTKGGFERNLRDLLERLQSGGRTMILFVDELHSLLQARGDVSAADLLKPRLASTTQIIGATTQSEYRSQIAKDEALDRRFSKVTVEEPSPEETIEIVIGRLPYLESHHSVRVEPALVCRISELSDEYFPNLRRPAKTFALIDRAMAIECAGGAR